MLIVINERTKERFKKLIERYDDFEARIEEFWQEATTKGMDPFLRDKINTENQLSSQMRHVIVKLLRELLTKNRISEPEENEIWLMNLGKEIPDYPEQWKEEEDGTSGQHD